MVRQARVLAQATSDLVNAMRSDAEAEVDVDNSKKLLAAAKLLADATARMVEAAKVTTHFCFAGLIKSSLKLLRIAGERTVSLPVHSPVQTRHSLDPTSLEKCVCVCLSQ